MRLLDIAKYCEQFDFSLTTLTNRISALTECAANNSAIVTRKIEFLSVGTMARTKLSLRRAFHFITWQPHSIEKENIFYMIKKKSECESCETHTKDLNHYSDYRGVPISR